MDFIIRRKTLITMLFIAITMLGYISYNRLPMELYPVPEMPTLVVMVGTRVNVDAEYMEQQAIIPVEGAIGTLEDVEEITSYASRRNSTIEITYNDNTDMKFAYLRLQEKINEVQSRLGDEFTLSVNKVNINSMSNQFMNLQLLGEGGVDRLRNLADQELVTKIENIDGIASVNVFGGRQKSVEIMIDPDLAEAYNLTPNKLSRLLQSGNSDRTFLGEAYKGEHRYFVNLTAEFTDISDIANVVVDNNGPVLLKDIADISFGTKEETSYSRVNGMDAITLMLINDNEVNIIDLSHKTRELIDQLNDELQSANAEIIIQSDSAETMENNINQIIMLAVIGGILAVVILWYFLQNVRLVVAVALAIPISVYTAFNFFYAYDISINSFTLIGLALAIGMLIDNSVVVLENIYRLAGIGKNARDSVLQGTREVWRSIFAATLTTICVFLPFLFANDIVIKLIGKQIGVSIVSTLLISLLVAMLFIPMVTHLFLKRKNGKAGSFSFERVSIRNRLVQVYLLFLKACMRNPAGTIIGAVVVFFVTIGISLTISTNDLQEVENNKISVYVTMPTGASLESTDELVAKLEAELVEIPENDKTTSKIEEGTGIININLKEDYEKESERDLAEIKDQVQGILNRYDDFAELDFEQSSSNERFSGGRGAQKSSQRFERMMGMGQKQERVVIKGEDYVVMQQVAEDLEYYLDELDEITRVNSDMSRNTPEVHLDFDSEVMGRNNIGLQSVSSELGSFKKEIESGFTFKQDNEEYEVVIKMDTVTDVEENSMADLQKLEIDDDDGAVHELQNIAKIYFSSGISRITRINQEKQIELSIRYDSEINESKDLLEDARAQVDELVASMLLPSGVAVEVIHEENDFAEYYILIALAFLLIYMILASVFESFSTPFVLMFTIPLAGIGSFLGLILTGNSLQNTSTITGFLILLGVVVNNGIILIDYANILQKRGYRRSRALMLAGLARLRPILITAITTITAMLPLALGNNEYVGVIGAPFAITVIGGLAVSTFLTLIFIPTCYSGLQNTLAWFKKLPIWLRLLQYSIYIIAGLLIYTEVDKFLWQVIDGLVVLIVVPASIWFFMNSLRKAQETVIAPESDITIRIQNLVKVYDRDNRFTREWKGGIKLRKTMNDVQEILKLKDLTSLSWKIPLLGFLVYFTFFYLESPFWQFVFVVLNYFFVMGIINPLKELQENRVKRGKPKAWLKLLNAINWAWYWLAPLFGLALQYVKYENLGANIVWMVLWYTALFINAISLKLVRENININRLTGRGRKIRRVIYSMVLSIPIIGKRKQPFKALKGVSLEIGNGMYGLLGPNGAGKSTLMRAICGINQQSYGKIWFNDIDTEEKREELQGLIGYLPQEFGMYENMSAWDYLNYQSILKRINDRTVREERVTQVLKSVHMWDSRKKKIGSFSGGMKQRIGIAQVLLHLPRVLIVDEPTAGLDPRERIRFRNLLVELSRNRIVIFSTHIIEDISSSCNEMAVLKKGAVQYVGSPREMTEIARGHVWQIYIPALEFEQYSEKVKIIHHLRDGDKIRLRILSEDNPGMDAMAVEPNLEDAYLWLQNRNVN